jgi:hypothetical protein
MNLKERLESHAIDCRKAIAGIQPRPPLPQDIRDELQSLRDAGAGAYLTGADLTGADLAGADLANAYLTGAYLTGANLAGADLAGAYLTGAYLTDAYLADAYLAGANLARAYLADAYLAGAYLADAYLAGAKNAPTVPVATEAPDAIATRRAARARRFRERCPEIPVVEHLDAKILAAIDGGSGKLDMGTWHTCETTHCRAGWAVQLAGAAGKELEARLGPHRAGLDIYRASAGHVPDFFASNENALADIKECAAIEASLP